MNQLDAFIWCSVAANNMFRPRARLLTLAVRFLGFAPACPFVKSAEAVFVLHCFQKKSKRGVTTPKEDMDIIHARLKVAQAYVKELRK